MGKFVVAEDRALSDENYLVTGAAGFIGSFLAKALLEAGCKVTGIDNLNAYYDVGLKEDRLSGLSQFADFNFIKADISDQQAVMKIFASLRPAVVIHLAAQAGVRYSLENPRAYIEANIIGHFNILEACREYPVRHLIYASSSSVYGNNTKVPFSEKDNVDQPVSLYAATKKADELITSTYSYLYKIPATGLRFFTVYGPLGRPDMAYFAFVDKYFAGEPISIFNNGDFENDLYRDFTYIDDIVQGIIKLIPMPQTGGTPHVVYNIGNNQPQKLMRFISVLEKCLSHSLGREVGFLKQYEPMKAGDVKATYADTSSLEKATGFKPQTSIESGLQRFTDWYVEYYKVK